MQSAHPLDAGDLYFFGELEVDGAVVQVLARDFHQSKVHGIDRTCVLQDFLSFFPGLLPSRRYRRGKASPLLLRVVRFQLPVVFEGVRNVVCQ